MILSFVLVISVFILILLTVRSPKVIYIRLLSIPALCLVFIVCIVIFSNTAVKSALNGLILWSSIVVPSLFPFFVASELMNSTGFTRAAGVLLEPVMRPFFNVPGCASFALALGVSSGYPVGAKITADMRKNGSLTKPEAERLLAFTNNSGPLFIIGAVGTGMFGSSSVGLFLFVCHLLSCITVGFIFRFYKRRLPGNSGYGASLRPIARNRGKAPRNIFKNFKSLLTAEGHKKKNFGELLGSAVRNSVSSILVIGGFIVLFSVIISLLDETGIIGMVSGSASRLLEPLFPDIDFKSLLSGVFGGLFEITTGSRLISRGISVPLYLKLPAVSFLIGWAGLSVHFQVLSIISETDIDIRPYLIGKFIQGIIASIYTLMGISLLNVIPGTPSPVLGTGLSGFSGLSASAGSSIHVMMLVLVVCFLIGGSGNRAPDCKGQKKKSSI
jgi:sporulation integral membrane protein YlbJ